MSNILTRTTRKNNIPYVVIAAGVFITHLIAMFMGLSADFGCQGRGDRLCLEGKIPAFVILIAPFIGAASVGILSKRWRNALMFLLSVLGLEMLFMLLLTGNMNFVKYLFTYLLSA